MSEVNRFTKRNHLPQKQLFEGAFYTLYDDSFVNLTAGAPGPELLAKCCEIFEIGTKHRMVSLAQNVQHYNYLLFKNLKK